MASLGLRVRVLKLTSILACGIVALGASPALATKGKKRAGLGPVWTVKAIGPTVPTGSMSKAIATCPSGKQAASGGFSAPFDATSSVVVTDSFRSSPRSWTVIGVPEAGTGAATAYAYCRQTTKTIMDVAGTGVVGNYMYGGGTAQATCPVGASLIGGGFESTKGVLTGPVQIAIPEDSWVIPPGAWTVGALNNSTPFQTITAHAYCVFGILPAIVVNTSAIQTVAARFDTVTARSPNCTPKKGRNKRKRKRQFLSAGGFSLEGGTGTIVASQSLIGPKGIWLAQVSSVLNQPGALWLVSWAICD